VAEKTFGYGTRKGGSLGEIWWGGGEGEKQARELKEREKPPRGIPARGKKKPGRKVLHNARKTEGGGGTGNRQQRIVKRVRGKNDQFGYSAVEKCGSEAQNGGSIRSMNREVSVKSFEWGGTEEKTGKKKWEKTSKREDCEQDLGVWWWFFKSLTWGPQREKRRRRGN